MSGSVNYIFLENVVFEMESEKESELGKWKVFIRQVCPECLYAGNEVHTGLVGMMGQLGLARTLVMGDKWRGGH